MYLEEKRIPYRVSKVPMRCYGQKPAWFSRLSATGLLPVVEIDGEVIIESDVILQALEDRFPDGPQLLPLAREPSAQAVPALLRLERELFSAWLRWLTGSTVTNERQELAFVNTLARVEEALAAFGGPYFLGEIFSLIDAIFAPFLERMAASLCYYKGFRMRSNPRFPNVERWFRAMETRASFRNIKSDWYTYTLTTLPTPSNPCIPTQSSLSLYTLSIHIHTYGVLIAFTTSVYARFPIHTSHHLHKYTSHRLHTTHHVAAVAIAGNPSQTHLLTPFQSLAGTRTPWICPLRWAAAP